MRATDPTRATTRCGPGATTFASRASPTTTMLLAVGALVSTGVAAQTVFPGGSIDDLRALSPTLDFGHLVIDGDLVLEAGSSTTLTVDRLTLAADADIRYAQGACDYFPGPSLAIASSGAVELLGDVLLDGRSGTRVSSGATCNQCSGVRAGTLTVDAASISAAGAIRADGGSGSTLVFSGFPSSGCSGGAGGAIALTAPTVTLTAATLDTHGGSGGVGGGSTGADGAPGSVDLTASTRLTIRGGAVGTDGELALTAGATTIYAPLDYGSIDDSIAGSADTTPPALTIVAPDSGGAVRLDSGYDIQIDLADAGTGVRAIAVSGLGIDTAVAPGTVIGDRLTVHVANPLPPGTLTVTATDNKGFERTRAVSDLVLWGDFVLPQGQAVTLTGSLEVGPFAAISVDGTLTLPRGADVVLSGGSFTLGTNGRIVQQPPTQETKATRAPSLTVNVTGTARIAGTIDLSGGDGLPISNALQHGESGGNLDVFAADIDVTGALFSNGGDGVTRQFGFPAQTIAAGGGSGGRVRLVSRGALDLDGTVHTDGGRSPNTGLGGCFDGGDGGTLELHHAGTITLADPTLGSVGGTTNTTFFCDEVRPGSPGWAQVVYRGSGPAPAPPRLDVPEVESNDGPTDAQPLMYLSRARVVGTIANGESPELSVGAGDGSTHDIYDWYAIGFPGNERLTLTLDHATSGKRLGVVVGRADPDGSTAIVGGLVSVTPGEQIVVEFDNTGTVPELAVGPYVVGITMNRLDAPTASYTLTVAATPPATSTPPAPPPILSPVPDADGDGVLDADDNCQAVANPTQLDTDGDDLGNACDPDDDGDGMSDAFETEHGLDPLDASDATRDDDGDSLINRDEAAAGTDPTDADTDGDGVSDGAEIAAGRNPTLNEGALAPLLQMILER